MIDLSNIPSSPGTYLYRDNKGKIIYIGKAKNLNKRVRSYFQKKNHDPKTEALVKSIDDVEFFVTSNEGEALILENNLIKKYTPKYNIDLKDSKRYAYLQITDEPFPRLLLARKLGKSGKYFGPFISAYERTSVRDFVTKTFKIRTCKRLPKKPCLRYHIKLCDAPCIKNITLKSYDENIRKAILVLKGNSPDLIKQLKQEMNYFSKQEEYEKALEARNQINALERLNERQNVERQKKYDEDIVNYIVKENTVYLLLFNIYKGTLQNKLEYSFPFVPGFLEQFLSAHYSENIIPREIILPQNIDSELIEIITSKRNSQSKNKGKVIVTIPKKGEKKQLLDLVKKNIEFSFFGDLIRLEELQKQLKLNELPVVIECFDISHLSGTSTVGSMVQFRNGRPVKSNYRRFRIKSVHKIDDFQSIAEVVRRRYTRIKNEGIDMPHLIVIDGGKGQLSSAINELRKLEIKIPIISLAKRLEEIYTPGMSFPIVLKKNDKGLQLLQAIRDEAHRFAIKYNRLLRTKSLKE